MEGIGDRIRRRCIRQISGNVPVEPGKFVNASLAEAFPGALAKDSALESRPSGGCRLILGHPVERSQRAAPLHAVAPQFFGITLATKRRLHQRRRYRSAREFVDGGIDAGAEFKPDVIER